MLQKKLFLGLLAVTALTGIAAPAFAKTNVDVYLNFGPPAPRYEGSPSARLGYVWAPGYWNWRGNSYVWIAGHYVRERPGYYWHTPQWLQGSQGWYSQPGRWDRQRPVHYADSDRDGIPNYRDNTPYGRTYNNYNGRRIDSDRDGIPNYRDRFPNDRDNDGIPNYRDRFPNDRDNDGRPDRRDRNPYNPRR